MSSSSTPSRSRIKRDASTPTTTTTTTRSTAGTPKRRVVGGPHSTSTALTPSLPRPPSWQNSIASVLAPTPASSSTIAFASRRSKRSSKDERDPGASGSDNDDDEQLEGDVFGKASRASSSSNSHTIMDQKRRSRSRSFVNPAKTTDENQNICVCVRVRPSAPNADEFASPIWSLQPALGKISLSEHHPIMEKRKSASTTEAYDFQFDSLLLPPNPTESLYNDQLSETIQSVMGGYNGTIFSYGQTGSGKTHTMMGSDDEPGIIPLAIQEIFSSIRSDPSRNFLLQLSYLEIYKESLRDLLRPETPSAKLQLVEDEKIKGKIKCTNLLWEVVTNPVQVFDVIMRGEKNRSVAGTDWNERSSRSHCVLSMIVESEPSISALAESASTELPYASGPSSSSAAKKDLVVRRVSQLNLIDLAGSERATSSEDRRSEGAHINKSLLYLGNVIEKLADGKGKGHVNYRDSKLTRLLQTSLSGNARIAIICTISPEARHGVESVSTLKFAARASKVVTRAERGDVADPNLLRIASLQDQIQSLKEEMALSVNGLNSTAQDDEALLSEREKRQKAENDAEFHRLKAIQLQEQLDGLKSQIVTSSSASQPLSYVPSSTSKDYGEIGSSRTPGEPCGPRGRRRISELSFIGTPVGKLKHATSARSFSSNLEIIKSPSLLAGLADQDNVRIKELEEEVLVLREKAERSEGVEEEAQELRDRIDTLQTELIHVHDKMRDAVREKDAYIQEAGEQASATMKLQRELESAAAKLSMSEASHGTDISQLQAEISMLRLQLAEKNAKVTELREAQGACRGDERNLLDTQRELEEVQAELEEVKRMSSGKDAALSTQRKQLESFKAELEDALRVQTELEEAEADLLKLRQELADSRKTTEKHAQLEDEVKALRKQVQEKDELSGLSKKSAQREIESLKRQLADKDRVHSEQETITREQKRTIEELEEQVVRKEQVNAEQSQILVQESERAEEQSHELELARAALASAQKEARNVQTQLVHVQEASQRKLADLESSARLAASSLQAQLDEARAMVTSQAGTIQQQRAELDKKEATREAIRAANNPDFSALRAKIQAVSHSAGVTTPSARSLSSSSHGEQHSQEESRLVKTVENLRLELTKAQTEAASSVRAVAEQKSYIAELLANIARLEVDIEKWRKHVITQGEMLKRLTEGDADQLDLVDQLENLDVIDRRSTPASQAETPPLIKPVRAPFAALGHHQSGSFNMQRTSIRPSTPGKKDGHAYTSLSGTPEPLPTPPGMWEDRTLRKSRRTTIEHDMENLRQSRPAERSKSILLSPKSERVSEWRDSQQHSRNHTISNLDELKSIRSKKSSAESYIPSKY